MAQQLTVKAYLKRWNAERKQQEMVEEIRRFSVDEDVATSYTYLLAKVTNVFPALNNKSTTLYWRGSFFFAQCYCGGKYRLRKTRKRTKVAASAFIPFARWQN